MSALDELYDIAAKLAALPDLTGYDFADEHGWLSDVELREKQRVEREHEALTARARETWSALSENDRKRYAANVKRALERLRNAHGKADVFHEKDVAPRAQQTLEPERKLDTWVIWAVARLCQAA